AVRNAAIPAPRRAARAETGRIDTCLSRTAAEPGCGRAADRSMRCRSRGPTLVADPLPMGGVTLAFAPGVSRWEDVVAEVGAVAVAITPGSRQAPRSQEGSGDTADKVAQGLPAGHPSGDILGQTVKIEAGCARGAK